MKKLIKRCVLDATVRVNAWLVLVTVSVMLVVSCGGGGGGGGGDSSTGTVSVSMTDAATTDYKAVYVTVARVQVCRGQTDSDSCWQTVGTPNKTYDLLTLVNGALETLGQTTLPSGQYSQVRLILANTPDSTTNINGHPHPYANYFVDKDDNEQELRVPSGYQTGIKIVRGFDIDQNQTTELILDFDATRSIVKAGSSGHWNLKPTIKVVTEYSIIQGNVSYSNVGIAGVLVSAQAYSPGTVTVAASTVSDDNGDYKLLVDPGPYTVVGYKDGYVPYYSTTKVTGSGGTAITHDFTLSTASMGSVFGTVYMNGASADAYSTISLRQPVVVGGASEAIEVKCAYRTSGVEFRESLPYGIYVANISATGWQTVPLEFTISTATPSDLGSISLQAQ